MRFSLPWQILWAPALAVAVAAALVVAEVATRNQLLQRVAAVTQMRESLDRALLRLSDRHERTMRRAQEAILDPRQSNREAILNGTAEHYQNEMARYESEARRAIAAVNLPWADQRLTSDLERLTEQLNQLDEEVHNIVPMMETLIAVVAAEDGEGITSTSQEIERADRAILDSLRMASGIVRRASMWQLQQALSAPAPLPSYAWLLLALWTPIAVLIALRPVRRLQKLAREREPHGQPHSPEEAALAGRLTSLHAAAVELERQVSERTRESERVAQASRRLERELALLRLYNDNLVNSLRSAVIVTDAGLIVRSMNRVARTMLALPAHAIDAPVETLAIFAAVGTRTPDARATLEHALSERAMLRYESLPCPGVQGEILLDLSVVPYLDESGAARGLLWIADDVSEAVRTKNQLLVAERLAAVGRLSAQVAHEIRNPLSAIGLNAELLADDFVTKLPEPERRDAKDLLTVITNEVERLTQVTEGYLQLARTPRPTLREADLNQVVTDLVSMLREELNSHVIAVTLDLASPPPRARTDAGQLRQALLNVVRNSREAMPTGGTIRITTRQTVSASSIEVHDSGPGIPPEVLPRIFEPFFSTKEAGTGLGLSLSRQIIEEHGGSIRAANDPQGGAVVTLTFPHLQPDVPTEYTAEAEVA